MAWLWIVLLLIVAGAAVWYLVFKNKRPASSKVGVDHGPHDSLKDAMAAIAYRLGGTCLCGHR
jgi:hypothetical protein